MITYKDLPFEIQTLFRKFPIGITVDSAIITQRIFADMGLTQQDTEIIPLGRDSLSPYYETSDYQNNYFAIKILAEQGSTQIAICMIHGQSIGFVLTEDTNEGKAILTQIKLIYA